MCSSVRKLADPLFKGRYEILQAPRVCWLSLRSSVVPKLSIGFLLPIFPLNRGVCAQGSGQPAVLSLEPAHLSCRDLSVVYDGHVLR